MIKICNVADVFAVNSYFCIDDKTGHGFLIDPGAEAGFLSDVIDKKAKVSHLPFYRLFQMMASCKLQIINSLTFCKRKLMLYINCLLQHLMVTKHAELLQVH